MYLFVVSDAKSEKRLHLQRNRQFIISLQKWSVLLQNYVKKTHQGISENGSVKFVVRAERDQASESDPDRVEDLGGRVDPHLRKNGDILIYVGPLFDGLSSLEL